MKTSDISVLNHDFSFTDARPEVQKAFRSLPQRVLINSGERLFRLITNEQGTIKGNEVFGEWWFHTSTWLRLSQIAARTKGTLVQAARAKFALTNSFSSEPNDLIIIIFTRPVYAWRGIARWQSDATSKVTLMGGLEQYYIPSLAVSHEGLYSAVAKIESSTGTLI